MRSVTYAEAGVDLDAATEAKKSFSRYVDVDHPRVLNKMGAFGSLVDGTFPGYKEPVLVLKMEEPGSKQKLAIQHGHISSICCDLVNHLTNDIIVMGAKPLFVQDTIICGRIEKEVVCQIVQHLSRACKEQDCVLTGGETSEQPGVVEEGTYILVASIIGLVDRHKIIDGSRITKGDTIIALASNGLHTNGYSLVRKLIQNSPEILNKKVGGETFLETILTPHYCYYHDVKEIFDLPELHGMAHITGGGTGQNLGRIIPEDLSAIIDLERIRVLPIFETIRRAGNLPDHEMIQTYNMGVGMCIVASKKGVPTIQRHLEAKGCPNYPIGTITTKRTEEEPNVVLRGRLN